MESLGKNRINYFPALTGVRALAAYLVFICHYEYDFDSGFPQTVKRYLQEFHIGVTIFFVLSGFLITYRYYDSFKIETGWFKKYIRNRVARIYPMYFILSVCVFIYFYFTGFNTELTGKSHPVGLLIANLLLIKGFFNSIKFSGIGPGWSLTVEECFYLLAPFIFMVFKKYRVFYLQVIVLTAFGFLLVSIFKNKNLLGFFNSLTFMMIYTFFGRCFEFFAGIKLALIMMKRSLQTDTKVAYTYMGLIMIFVCPLIMSLLPIPQGWTAGLHNPFGIIINNYILALAIALFFYGLLTETSTVKKILAHPFTELLGKSSYIFYLIHLTFIAGFIQIGINKLNDTVFALYDKWDLNWHSPFEYDGLNTVYLFILLNALSILLFKLIEEPLNYYIRKSTSQPLITKTEAS